jgi:hypothetical protein
MKYLLLAVLCLGLTGCAGTTIENNALITDGKLTTTGALTLQVAVGAAMNAKPESIKPAYLVTGELLNITGNNTSTFTDVDKLIEIEINKLELDPLTKQSVIELAGLIKQTVVEMLKKEGLSTDQRMVVAIDVIKIIHQAAKARLAATTPTLS